jgi:hypothetical protein
MTLHLRFCPVCKGYTNWNCEFDNDNNPDNTMDSNFNCYCMRCNGWDTFIQQEMPKEQTKLFPGKIA